MHGKLIKATLLNKYGLPQFTNIIQAMKIGDLRLFKKALQEHERYFISKGIYLIVERLQAMIYRKLFHRTFIILNRNPKLPLSAFKIALDFVGENLSIEEIECITAGLIDQVFFIFLKEFCIDFLFLILFLI